MNDLISGILTFAALVIIVAVLISLPVMLLWNWIAVSLFGFVSIGFWEALGLSMLCSLLFKSSIPSGKN